MNRAAARTPDLLDPQGLYELWERQHWAAHAIDLSHDRADWSALAAGHRERLHWHIASFFVGEERVTLELTALVAAHETASEAAFLATQQVDEARHTQHFARFYSEIVGARGGVERHLRDAREDLSDALRALLDVRLAGAARRLGDEPGDQEAKVEFVALYHMIIEGTLALTGQAMLLDFLERAAILPGWREGLRLVARDEHRHVAYGTWLLRAKARDPALRRRLVATLGELVPLAASVLVPPGARPELFRPLHWDGVRVHDFAARALGRRLRVVGLRDDVLAPLLAPLSSAA